MHRRNGRKAAPRRTRNPSPPDREGRRGNPSLLAVGRGGGGGRLSKSGGWPIGRPDPDPGRHPLDLVMRVPLTTREVTTVIRRNTMPAGMQDVCKMLARRIPSKARATHHKNNSGGTRSRMHAYTRPQQTQAHNKAEHATAFRESEFAADAVSRPSALTNDEQLYATRSDACICTL